MGNVRLTRRSALFGLCGSFSLAAAARAQQALQATSRSNPIVVNNVRIFDGAERCTTGDD